MRKTEEKLASRVVELEKHLLIDEEPLDSFERARHKVDPGAIWKSRRGQWARFAVGDRWGGPHKEMWLRGRVTIPKRFAGKTVHLMVVAADERDVAGPEALLYVDGVPRQGMDTYHPTYCLTQRSKGGDKYNLALRFYSGRFPKKYTLKEAKLVCIDSAVNDLYWDTKVALDLLETLPKDLRAYHELLDSLDKAFLAIDLREPGSGKFYDSIKKARACFSHYSSSGKSNDGLPTVTCVGHAHLDVGWLWRVAETRVKAARTFSTVLRLMEKNKDFYFLQSQPQLYEFIKTDYPEIYPQIKKRVREGRWEAAGGMWVEADCNIPSGESLVRQILFGKRFLQKEFGTDCEIMWLPDAFGYPWSLPQIMLRAGMKYFMTTKTSWSQYNQIPHDSFWWKGPDGSKVLTHFITAAVPECKPQRTYNGVIDPQYIKHCWCDYKQKSLNSEVLLAFGYGDGGGGPTQEMLENASRLAKLPGSPHVAHGRAEDFFKRLEKVTGNAPVWNDELYVEIHRGTYTTQSRMKRWNRKCEFLYHNAEIFSSIALLFGYAYQQRKLNEGWKELLLQQFHDILPGSSIAEVYEDAEKAYKVVDTVGKETLGDAMDFIAKRVKTTDAEGEPFLVFNSLPWKRNDIVKLAIPAGGPFAVVDGQGKEVPSQIISKGKKRELLIYASDIPAAGYKCLYLKKSRKAQTRSELQVSDSSLENRFFKVSLDRNGLIRSIRDKQARREIVPAGTRANELQAFEDKPVGNDAWDVDIFFEEKRWADVETKKIEVIEKGPVRAGLKITRKILNSSVVQYLYIYRDVPRIDFYNEVDWQEKHVLLKVAFPVNINAICATYDIQFANIQRTTHWNTSWDWARFEACGHKWVDLSEGDYGVSLLNDCKYGHDIKDNCIRLSLLRSPTDPDPHADEGHHIFTYSLHPHTGDWRSSTVHQGYQLNVPLIARRTGRHAGILPSQWSLLSVNDDNLIVETVKKAEDGKALVVRLYECHNQRGTGELTFAYRVRAAWECDLLENKEKQIKPKGKTIRFRYDPYQIRTFMVELESPR